MNISVQTFLSPFSFFCVPEEHKVKNGNCYISNNRSSLIPIKFQDVTHGQYLAVLVDNTWQRGIVSLENMFQIWLVDLGYYLRPNEQTIYTTLAPEYKKLPSKVFEASIHGVAPMKKNLNEDCEFVITKSVSAETGCVQEVNQLLSKASRCIFIPIAVMSTTVNDVVLGDLYLMVPNKGVINLIDELENWPYFVERDKEFYIKNLSKFYTSRRIHHFCRLKPDFPNLPVVNTDLTLIEYSAICANVQTINTEHDDECDSSSEISEDGATVLTHDNSYKTLKLTPQEIERYATEYFTISGIKYNVLNIVINKARDFKMCEKYKDLKSFGRANKKK